MTSMHRNYAQPFQISNYGVGGYHYEHSVVQHQVIMTEDWKYKKNLQIYGEICPEVNT